MGTAATSATRFEDVETLRGQIENYRGKRVTVSGEVKRILSPRAFVLESGGLINDDLVGVMPKAVDSTQSALVRDDANLVVTGKLHRGTATEVQTDLGWEWEAPLRDRLTRVNDYLVVDRITTQQAR